DIVAILSHAGKSLAAMNSVNPSSTAADVRAMFQEETAALFTRLEAVTRALRLEAEEDKQETMPIGGGMQARAEWVGVLNERKNIEAAQDVLKRLEQLRNSIQSM
ncbi:uncharacterized protein V1518DRAFT_376591, partial [Limtongia smithiae]|uniref:uncharacterized protein n=1 Tax=Limtongia smithiae TaxID=1125753 RepID=UPI0034CD6840